MKKETSGGSAKKGAWTVMILLTVAIVCMIIILLYLIGIAVSERFARQTLKIPVLSQVTRIVAGNIYEIDDTNEEINVRKKETDSEKEVVSQDASEKSTLLAYQSDAPWDYLKECYFIGDSRTVALAAYDLIADENTIAEVGLSHIDALQHVYTQKSGMQYDVASFLEAKQPDILYIAFGVNGIAFVEESRYKEEYENMMDQILSMAPNSKVVIEAIGPIKEGYSMTSRMTNADIDHYNEFLYDLAEEKGIYYVDSNKCLKDDYNSLKDEYNSGDGLHYTQDGYAQVAEYIRSHPVTE